MNQFTVDLIVFEGCNETAAASRNRFRVWGLFNPQIGGPHLERIGVGRQLYPGGRRRFRSPTLRFGFWPPGHRNAELRIGLTSV